MYVVQHSLYEKKYVRIPSPRMDEKKKKFLKILGFLGIISIVITLIIITIKLWPSPPKLRIILGVEGEVIINGKSAGFGTEFLFEELETGIHTISATPTKEIPFLTEEKIEINLGAGAEETLEILTVCKLDISSTPPSARIIISSVNGDLSLGITPVETVIPKGHFEVNIRLPGYPEYRQSILTIDREQINIEVDLAKLALSEPGAKKLVNNLKLGSFRAGSSLVVGEKEFKEPGLYQIEPGIHNTTLVYRGMNIITTEIVYPSVGKPVILSCPENLTHVCLHFGEGLFDIPPTAIDTTISADSRFLLFTTSYRWVYEYINAVNLTTGKLVWSSDVNSAWDLRPVIIGATDSSNIYGMSGVPSKHSATPFILDLEKGFEETTPSSDKSILPMMGNGFDIGSSKVFAHVWQGHFGRNKIITGLEVLLTGSGADKRFLKILKDNETAEFLGYSVSARKDKKPVFVFLKNNRGRISLLVLDPALVGNNKSNKEEPEWVSISVPFKPTGIISDKGFNTANSIIIFDENSTASISYPGGKVRWKRFFQPAPLVTPIFQMIKDKPAVLFSFSKKPFELQLDIKSGKEIEKRTNPITAEEFYGSKPATPGVFIQDNTVLAGVREKNGEFIYRWKKKFLSGELVSTRWGVIHIDGDKFSLLASHKLEPILAFSLPGFKSDGYIQVFSTSDHLAFESEGRCWIIDRDGLLKGYYIGITELGQFGNDSQNALSAVIGGRLIVIPWPE